jgi:hypothetical protein
MASRRASQARSRPPRHHAPTLSICPSGPEFMPDLASGSAGLLFRSRRPSGNPLDYSSPATNVGSC